MGLSQNTQPIFLLLYHLFDSLYTKDVPSNACIPMELISFTLLFLVVGALFYSAKYKVIYSHAGFSLFGYTGIAGLTVISQTLYLILAPGGSGQWVSQTTLPAAVFGFIFDLAILGHELLGRGSLCLVASQAMFATRIQKDFSASSPIFISATILFAIDAAVVGGLFGYVKHKKGGYSTRKKKSKETTDELLRIGAFF